MRALLFALLLSGMAARADDSPSALLAEAQAGRAALQQGLRVRVDVEHVEGSAREIVSLDVALRGEDMRLDVLAPAERAGETLLITSGRAWFSRPGLKRPTPVSRQQVLGGRASAGDLLLAVSRLDTLYDARSAGHASLGGVDCLVLVLSARSPDAPAPAATAWLSADHRLLKIALLDANNAVEKTATVSWGETVVIGGSKLPFPTAMTLVESSGTRTSVRYGAPVAGPLPETLFSPAALSGSAPTKGP